MSEFERWIRENYEGDLISIDDTFALINEDGNGVITVGIELFKAAKEKEQ